MKGECENGKRSGDVGNGADGVLRRGEAAVRESANYRPTLEWLNEQTHGKGWLSNAESARLLKIDRDTVRRRFDIHI